MAVNLSYLSIKTASEHRDHDEKQRLARTRNILVLILQYLKDKGLFEAAETLRHEAKTLQQDISSFAVCDNMDLNTILLEFECGYVARLQKKPRFTREILPEEKSLPVTAPQRRKHPSVLASKSDKKVSAIPGTLRDAALPEIITTKLLHKAPRADQGDVTERCTTDASSVARLSHALQSYENRSNGDLFELAQVISKEMYVANPNVHWSDIKGMEDAKRLVKEAVVYPVKYPEIFKGILAPWCGLLLAGPPGTGKTMLAKAVATECKTAFFNISPSTVISKWRGESEKLIRVLFDLARKCAPTTIFLDELDSLMGQRGENSEHEGSRRMKTEILIQMDGLQRSEDVVFVLAASNLPWELDSAMIRRLEKRVFVDLPSLEARKSMVSTFLPVKFDDHPLRLETQLDYSKLAELTAGYSGSDIHLVCREVAMTAVRKFFDVLDDDDALVCLERDITVNPIMTEDVVAVLRYTKPAESCALRGKYEEWKSKFESA